MPNAIFSLSHRPISKSKHRAGYAAAHERYITRDSAASIVLGTVAEQGSAYWAKCEPLLRANGRVCDRFMCAVPKDVPADRRPALATAFVAELVGAENVDRVPWVLAVHDLGDDAENPHFHLMLADRDFETGKRVWLASEMGSTEKARAAWERVANRALTELGAPLIDRRTLEAQGIERIATHHVGPKRGPQSEKAVVHNRMAKKFNAEMDSLEKELAEIVAERAAIAEAEVAPPPSRTFPVALIVQAYEDDHNALEAELPAAKDRADPPDPVDEKAWRKVYEARSFSDELKRLQRKIAAGLKLVRDAMGLGLKDVAIPPASALHESVVERVRERVERMSDAVERTPEAQAIAERDRDRRLGKSSSLRR